MALSESDKVEADALASIFDENLSSWPVEKRQYMLAMWEEILQAERA
jgi:hypothetical protein